MMTIIMLMRILVLLIMIVIMIIIRGPAGDDTMQEEQQGRRLWFSAGIYLNLRQRRRVQELFALERLIGPNQALSSFRLQCNALKNDLHILYQAPAHASP